MAFRGWPPTAQEFFAGLEADNSKSYWLSHKDVYECEVKAPMLDLLDELAFEFGEARLFRPFRDTRFSADKTPYKTSIAAMIGSRYVRLSAQGLAAGAGVYHMETDQLQRYRSAVEANDSGRELACIVADLRRARLEVQGTDPSRQPRRAIRRTTRASSSCATRASSS